MLTNKPSEVFTIRAIRTIIFACSPCSRRSSH
nr:MAG TPA: Tim15 import, zinc finger, PROTEIN [Caudoviricetes sp.]